MRFLVDAQLPPALARWIASQGHDTQHVADFGMAGAPDQAIWDKAVELNCVIVSKDEDFVHLSGKGSGPQLVWITFGNTTKIAMFAKMEKIFPQIAEALELGERVVEVR